MSVVKELLRAEADGKLSFGNYELRDKKKLEDFAHMGDVYKVKTFAEITDEVTVIGNMNRAEIWNPTLYAASRKSLDPAAKKAALADLVL